MVNSRHGLQQFLTGLIENLLFNLLKEHNSNCQATLNVYKNRINEREKSTGTLLAYTIEKDSKTRKTVTDVQIGYINCLETL